ncbi:MAG: acyl-CoA thioesterase [Candidatus Puniceispirillaceae bacterium]
MSRLQPSRRADYPFVTRLATRWDDNDIYGHLNNTVHYKLMDTAVNGWLLQAGLLDPHHGATVYLVVETGCSYFAELGYPAPVDVGLRITRLGGSSVTYDIGLFAPDADSAAARGRFIHVHVARDTHRPVAVGAHARAAFARLVADSAPDSAPDSVPD